MESTSLADMLSYEIFDLSKPLSKAEMKDFARTPLYKIYKKHPNLRREDVEKIYLRLPRSMVSKSTVRGKRYFPVVSGVESWVYSGEINESDETHGQGLLVNQNGSVYEGSFRQGNMNGHGIMITPESMVYKGVWQNYSLEEEGTIINVNCKKVYSGQLTNMTPYGRGREITASGLEYHGEFKAGKRHGQGKIWFANGDFYEGSFANNHFEGLGTFYWKIGSVYTGNWQMSKMHGEGEYTWYHGLKYVGLYKEGKKQGYGELYYPNGKTYKGHFEKGKEDGLGTETDENGAIRKGIWKRGDFLRKIEVQDLPETRKVLVPMIKSAFSVSNSIISSGRARRKNTIFQELHFISTDSLYKNSLRTLEDLPLFDIEGEMLEKPWNNINQDTLFKGDLNSKKKPHGKGILLEHGNIYIGSWDNGEIEGYARYIGKKGNYYEGYWSYNKRHGFGVYQYKHEKYIGEWFNGKRSGYGCLFTRDGQYFGGWKNDEQDKQGFLKYTDGSIYKGKFKNGDLHGKGTLTLNNGDVFDGIWDHGNFYVQE